VPRKVILSSLFNHQQTSEELGWSTLRTQVKDFRGRKQTYNSHNGTDLCIPLGTTVVAPAAGQVGRVFREFNRGGLKIAIDHGEGLMTCAVHLARALVREGDVVEAGQPIAISGYSGIDGFATFPWGIPHVHFNVWLNTRPVDPFPYDKEGSIWRGGHPQPMDPIVDKETRQIKEIESDRFIPSSYDESAVNALIDGCITTETRERLRAIEPLWQRAAHVICERNYYPTRFPARATPGHPDERSVYVDLHPRAEKIDLPFLTTDFDGVVFQDEI